AADATPPASATDDLPPLGDIADGPPLAKDDPKDDDGREAQTITVEQPFAATMSKVRWLQTALTVDNYDPGPIDGALGTRTMEAVRSWRRDHGRDQQTGTLTEAEFRTIVEDFARRFDQIHQRAQSF
ncbi:MAG: hypothetical protein HC871_04735, partial [Rhizobiales bacterium]|nr:hypothetical protein [Hyphomicrobiales bacterium]